MALLPLPDPRDLPEAPLRRVMQHMGPLLGLSTKSTGQRHQLPDRAHRRISLSLLALRTPVYMEVEPCYFPCLRATREISDLHQSQSTTDNYP